MGLPQTSIAYNLYRQKFSRSSHPFHNPHVEITMYPNLKSSNTMIQRFHKKSSNSHRTLNPIRHFEFCQSGPRTSPPLYVRGMGRNWGSGLRGRSSPPIKPMSGFLTTPREFTTSEILKLLMAQNKSLMTKDWRVLRRWEDKIVPPGCSRWERTPWRSALILSEGQPGHLAGTNPSTK